MSLLKPGTLCVIVAGCPENIGLIVEVVSHLGSLPPRADAYLIRTVSGRFFPQLKVGPAKLAPGFAAEAITDRHKLLPLVDSNDKAEVRMAAIEAGSMMTNCWKHKIPRTTTLHTDWFCTERSER